MEPVRPGGRVAHHMRDRRRRDQLNNYQLDGEYTMSRLLAPGAPIKLVRFSGPPDGPTGSAARRPGTQAQTTPQGRAGWRWRWHPQRVAVGAGRRCPTLTTTSPRSRASSTSSSAAAVDLDDDGLRRIRPARTSSRLPAATVPGRPARTSSAADDSRTAAGARAVPRRRDLSLAATCGTSRGAPTSRPIAGRSDGWTRHRFRTGVCAVPSSTCTRSPTNSCRCSTRTTTRSTVRRAGAKSLLRQAFIRAPTALQLHVGRARGRRARAAAPSRQRPLGIKSPRPLVSRRSRRVSASATPPSSTTAPIRCPATTGPSTPSRRAWADSLCPAELRPDHGS